jgi:hypothetical protein
MAKQSAVRATEKPEETRDRIIGTIKAEFISFEVMHSALLSKSAYAEKFCNAFLDWRQTFTKDTMKAATKIGFVRAIVPDIPEDFEEYKKNKFYQAADYLFRIGMKTLKREAKDAVDKGKATARQKELANGKGRAKTDSKKSEENIKGVKLPLVVILETLAVLEIGPDALKTALKSRNVAAEIIEALVDAFSAVVKRVSAE